MKIWSSQPKKVNMVDDSGKVLKTFPSVGQAAEYCYGTAKHIREALDKPDRTCYGYHWQSVTE